MGYQHLSFGPFDSGDDLFGFAGGHHAPSPNPGLGTEVMLSDSGALSPVSHAAGHGGTATRSSTSVAAAPAPAVIGARGSNLTIDLIWDASVASAPAGFTSAVAAAAATLARDLSTAAKTTIYIDVGWGELNGQALDAGSLGESTSFGYLTSYSQVANALARHGDVLNATNEPVGSQFFVTNAEEKSLGLLSGTSGGAASPDGYIGFSTLSGTGNAWNLGGGALGAAQYDLRAIAEHEISEVMGRGGMQGGSTYNGQKTYQPLDLFDFSGAGTLSLSTGGGYFSMDGGASHAGAFNNASAYGGDVGDWASWNTAAESGTLSGGGMDAFDAFARPGLTGVLGAADLKELAALGYAMTPAGAAVA